MATATIANVQFTGSGNQAISFSVTTFPADGETVVDVKAMAFLPADVPADQATVPEGASSLNHDGGDNWSCATLGLPAGTGLRKLCVWPIVQKTGQRAVADVTIPGGGGDGA